MIELMREKYQKETDEILGSVIFDGIL